jgi:hypothetical protein
MTRNNIVVHGTAQIEVTAQTSDNAPSVNEKLLAERMSIDDPNHWIRETTITNISNIEDPAQFTREKDKLVTGTIEVFIRTKVDRGKKPVQRVEALLTEARGIVAGERYTVKGVELINEKQTTVTKSTKEATSPDKALTPK